MTTATAYTRDQLTARGMSRPKLDTIAIEEIGLNPDVVRLAPNKREVIEMILQAQEAEEAVGIENQAHSDEIEESEYLEPVEESDEEDTEAEESPWQDEEEPAPTPTELSYEQRLLQYLNACQSLDEEATYLVTNWAAFKLSLIPVAPAPTRSRQRRSTGNTPRTRTSNPADKINQAKGVWEKVRELGTPKAAAEALGKSPHYTKMIARAYDIYQQSKVIRSAYDSGSLPWTQLYDIAFRNRVEKEGLAAVEAAVTAIATA